MDAAAPEGRPGGGSNDFTGFEALLTSLIPLNHKFLMNILGEKFAEV